MADDIVNQIIALADGTSRSDGRSTLYGAAAEIERLRRENDWYKAVNTQLQSDLAAQHEDQFLTYFRQALQRADDDL